MRIAFKLRANKKTGAGPAPPEGRGRPPLGACFLIELLSQDFGSLACSPESSKVLPHRHADITLANHEPFVVLSPVVSTPVTLESSAAAESFAGESDSRCHDPSQPAAGPL